MSERLLTPEEIIRHIGPGETFILDLKFLREITLLVIKYGILDSLLEAQDAKTDPIVRAEERVKLGEFLEESKETFYVVYRDSAGEQTYTIARHAIDKIIKSLKQSKAPWEMPK